MKYRVPVYKVGCKGNVIIWQVDVAFDERHDHNMQVVKGISNPCLERAIGKSVPNVRIFLVWSICAYADVCCSRRPQHIHALWPLIIKILG